MGESLFISSRATIRRQIVPFHQSSALWMTKMMTTIEDNNKGTTFVWPLDSSSLSTNPSVKSTIKKPLYFLSKTSRLHSRSMTAELKEPPKLKLYSYWRSSCSQRVRIGLNLKGLEYEYKAVNLLKGEQFTPEFEKLNPLKYVPVLVDGDVTVSDSFAILLYLEDQYPEHPLLPKDLQKKALNIQAASIVGSSIQPLRTLTFLNYIEEKISTDEKLAWLRGHLSKGFAALEKLLKGCAGRYATGDEVQLADVFLAPQIEGGITRFQLDMSPFPTLARLHEAYCEHPAFQASQPNRQPDSPSSS